MSLRGTVARGGGSGGGGALRLHSESFGARGDSSFFACMSAGFPRLPLAVPVAAGRAAGDGGETAAAAAAGEQGPAAGEEEPAAGEKEPAAGKEGTTAATLVLFDEVATAAFLEELRAEGIFSSRGDVLRRLEGA